MSAGSVFRTARADQIHGTARSCGDIGRCNGHLVPAPPEAPRGTNSNGKLLAQFLVDAGMMVTNEADSVSFKPTRFMGSVGTTLDYIIEDSELAPKCNCTVEEDLTIDSDHRLALWI